jgi:hypothetical protein
VELGILEVRMLEEEEMKNKRMLKEKEMKSKKNNPSSIKWK